MKVATIVNAHGDPNTIRDTVDSICTYVGQDVLIIIDGAFFNNYDDISFPVGKIEGLYHNHHKSPYRNVALALSVLGDTYDADWYCYCEYDVLFGSDAFKRELALADKMNIWIMGNDGRVDEKRMPFIEAMLQTKFKSSYYLLGACLFINKKYMAKLKSIDFFGRFLNMTSGFTQGFMPFYDGYDPSENIYPTMARHFGGGIGVFATWDGATQRWFGSHKLFPIRFRPGLEADGDYKGASVLHPLKKYDDPWRAFFRQKRRQECDQQKP